MGDGIVSDVNASRRRQGAAGGSLTTSAAHTIVKAINPRADTITVTTHGCQWSANEVYCLLNTLGLLPPTAAHLSIPLYPGGWRWSRSTDGIQR